MMTLTKTPFLLTLITTIRCGAAHKKPLVGGKTQQFRLSERCTYAFDPHLDSQSLTQHVVYKFLQKCAGQHAEPQNKQSEVPREDVSVPPCCWLQLDSFFQLLLKLICRILLSGADFLMTWRTSGQQA